MQKETYKLTLRAESDLENIYDYTLNTDTWSGRGVDSPSSGLCVDAIFQECTTTKGDN